VESMKYQNAKRGTVAVAVAVAAAAIQNVKHETRNPKRQKNLFHKQ
jgi:hypothetical protein